MNRIPTITVVSDAVLVQEFCASRSEDAFAQIVSRHGGSVYRACLRLLGNRSDAEDAAQAVFLVLARRCKDVKGPLVPWLMSVARRVSQNLLVSRARRQRREKAAARLEPQTTESTAGLREELDAALAKLPAKLAEAVSLRYLEGRSQEEAAEISGCPGGTLGWRASEGLNRLRAILGRRGVVVAPAILAGFLAQQQALAVPETLSAKLTVAAAGKAAVSASAGALADAVARAALVAKLKVSAALIVAAAVAAAGAVVALRPAAPDRVMLASFDGDVSPVDQSGAPFPQSWFRPGDPDSGGVFVPSIERNDAVAGHSLRLPMTDGRFKAVFTFEGQDGIKLFARDYTADPASWRFDTYNRFRLWVKLPPSSPPHSTTGGTNMNLGTLVKRVRDAEPRSLDSGGGAYGHRFNVPVVGQWTQVIFNMHPSYGSGGAPVGVLSHPTSETGINYFDALTQIFVEARERPSQYPADYLLDEFEFYRESQPENDEQAYSITGTHVPGDGRIIVTWNRRDGEDSVAHEVRYAFTDIHRLGWQQAKPAPGGTVQPPGRDSDAGMVYDTRALPLAGQKMLYIAIKPQNAETFSQIAIPLTLK